MTAERELIAAIQRRTSGAAPGAAGLVQGIGDDCAIWRPPAAGVCLVTTDTLVEGVHFDRTWHPPLLLGRKAVAVNMSDIAAMGGIPRFVLLSLGLPGDEAEQWRDALLDGLAEAVAEYRALLIGGDTVRAPAGVVLTVTVIGEADPERVRLRSGGQAGDSVWLGGPLGLAAAGLEICRGGLGADPQWRQAVQAHLDPAAQVVLGQKLAAAGLVNAMMDLSDGLATDLAHLATASGLGADVEARLLPIPEIVRRAAKVCRADPLAWALRGGEDYQLLFTAPPANDEALARLDALIPGASLTRIGRLIPGVGVFLQDNGHRREIGYGGYDHFRRE